MGTAPPALADDSARVSPASDTVRPTAVEGRFWIWEWTDYDNDGGAKSYNTTDRYFQNDVWDGSTESVDNLATSAHNKTNKTARLYQFGSASGGNCSGYSVEFPPGSYSPDLGDFKDGTFDFNNKASCIVFYD